MLAPVEQECSQGSTVRLGNRKGDQEISRRKEIREIEEGLHSFLIRPSGQCKKEREI